MWLVIYVQKSTMSVKEALVTILGYSTRGTHPLTTFNLDPDDSTWESTTPTILDGRNCLYNNDDDDDNCDDSNGINNKKANNYKSKVQYDRHNDDTANDSEDERIDWSNDGS